MPNAIPEKPWSHISADFICFLYTTYTHSVFTLIYKVLHISFESFSLAFIDFLRKEKEKKKENKY